MIWLSSFYGAGEYSGYYDIRDMNIQCRDGLCSAKFSGIMGIGSLEFWTEIVLGTEETVQLLPVWNEDGDVDRLPECVDQSALEVELIAEVKALLNQMKPASIKPVVPRWNNRLSEADMESRHLAA